MRRSIVLGGLGACALIALATGCSSKSSDTSDGADAAATVDAGTEATTDAGGDGGDEASDGGDAADANDAGDAQASTDPLAGGDCDPMVPTQCGYPFPSNVYLVDDKTTASGKRVKFRATTLPVFGGQIDPAAWADSDGFSPGATLLTHLPGATITGLPTQDTIAASIDAAHSPTLLIDTSTTPPTLVPHFSELDVSTAALDDQAFMIRPVVRLRDQTRYVVAIRNVVDKTGAPLAPNAVFQALRDGTPSTDPTVEPRRALYTDIFAALSAAGIDKSNLQLAWDFTTASAKNNTQQLVSMRDQAFAAIGPDGPSYTITSSTDNPDALTARRIHGKIHVPLFLDSATVGPDSSDITTGFVLQKDASGLPKQNGWGDFDFDVNIPASVGADTNPAPILIQGHGLFSDRSEGMDANSTGYSYFIKLAEKHKYVTVSVDMIGWRTPEDHNGWPSDWVPDVNPENDEDKAQGIISKSPASFRGMVDRGTQGMLNHLVAVRMMMTSLAKDPAMQINGHGVVDTTKAYYRGDSQGGILGVTFMALSQDVTRGYLGETGMPYSMLLMRSKDFSQFYTLIKLLGRTGRNGQLVLGLMQMFWDRLEGTGFANYVTGQTLPSTPSHNVLIHDAIGDFQVTPLGAHILARTLGAKNIKPTNRDLFGIDSVDGPYQGNGIVEFDFGLENDPNVTIPKTDTPPSTSGMGNPDPHDAIRQLDEAGAATDTFFRTGNATNTCVDAMMAPAACVFPEPH